MIYHSMGQKTEKTFSPNNVEKKSQSLHVIVENLDNLKCFAVEGDYLFDLSDHLWKLE